MKLPVCREYFLLSTLYHQDSVSSLLFYKAFLQVVAIDISLFTSHSLLCEDGRDGFSTGFLLLWRLLQTRETQRLSTAFEGLCSLWWLPPQCAFFLEVFFYSKYCCIRQEDFLETLFWLILESEDYYYMVLAQFSQNDTITSKEFLITQLLSGVKFTEEKEVNANLRKDTNQYHLCTGV